MPKVEADGNTPRPDKVLSPYIGTRAVTAAQISQALASGLTVEQIRDRLTEAECELAESIVAAEWDRGWSGAVESIVWLTTPANTEPLGINDLLDVADESRIEQRQGCYVSAVTTGTPQVDATAYSLTLGRVSCLEWGVRLVPDDTCYIDDLTDIADILRQTRDHGKLRAIIARQQALDANALLYRTWTPIGTISPEVFCDGGEQ